MPNVASVLKEEIRRLARKEARILTKPLKKAIAAERKQMTLLRKQFASLSQDTRRAARSAGRSAAAPADTGAVAAPGNWRKDTVRSTRKMLGVTQGQFAKLVGVSPISISFWETGRSTPRAKAQVKVLELRKLSKSDVVSRLGGAPGAKRRGRKPGRPKGSGKKAAGRKSKGPRKARGRRRAMRRVTRKAA
jgi:DNA-binding transcriptional regulator YiaG